MQDEQKNMAQWSAAISGVVERINLPRRRFLALVGWC